MLLEELLLLHPLEGVAGEVASQILSKFGAEIHPSGFCVFEVVSIAAGSTVGSMLANDSSEMALTHPAREYEVETNESWDFSFKRNWN